jgi:hypothetical protein
MWRVDSLTGLIPDCRPVLATALIEKFVNIILTLWIDSDIIGFERRRLDATNVYLLAVFLALRKRVPGAH